MLTFNALTASSNGALIYLGRAQSAISQSMERLSSGLRINSASDDAAGLAISVSMGAKIRSARQGIRNAYDGISMAQVAEGALDQVSQNVIRLRELAVQAASDPLSTTDRQGIQAESDQLVADIKRIASSTAFNGMRLLDQQGASVNLQTGSGSSDSLPLGLDSADPDNLGLQGTVTVAGGLTDTATLGDPSVFTGADAMVINGQQIPVQDDGASSTFGYGSALALVNAINAAGIGGLSASTAGTSANLGGVTFSGVPTPGPHAYAIDLNINGAAVGGVTWDPLSGIALGTAIATRINAMGVGISAGYNGSLTLNAADGRNIELTTGGGAGNQISFTSLNVHDGVAKDKTALGDILLTTATPIRINNGLSAAAGQGRSLTSGIYPSPLSGSGVMLSAQSALDYISVVDASLSEVTALRSKVGSMQNELGFTIANEENSIVNLEASRSRIVDADIAAETSTLTRAQILAQSGIAILAQANLNSKRMLSLLLPS